MAQRANIEQYVFGTTSLIANRMAAAIDADLTGITYKQSFFLMMIDRMDSLEKSVHDVAQFIGTTRQNARKIIEQLENKGYVETSVSKFDARALSVRITRKGRNALAKNAPLVAEATGTLFADISDEELMAFAQTLGKLVATLTAEEE